jgi:hypothetical protein
MTAEDERAARYSDLFEGRRDHTPDCAYCPICSGIAMVRSVKPEVLEHLAAAARELMIAAGLFLEDAGDRVGSQDDGSRRDRSPEPGAGAPRRTGGEGGRGVRRIDTG